MAELNMIFAGFGGQGVLFTGKVVSYAGLLDGKEVSWLPSYGPEMRGGTANCSVCISDEPIGSPIVTEPDVLVAMNGPSYDKFINSVKPGGKVIMDSALIDREVKRTDIEVYKIPATQLAIDKDLGGIANIILLGKLLGVTSFTDEKTLEEALKKCVPPRKEHLLEPNMRAIRLGKEQA
jgi:2-oxoglutarate ferredoxin oxidoreductase subunit gamma